MKNILYIAAIISLSAFLSCTDRNDEPNDDNPNAIKPIDLEWQKAEYDPNDFEETWLEEGYAPLGGCSPLPFEYRGIQLSRVAVNLPYNSELYKYYGQLPSQGGQFTLKLFNAKPYITLIQQFNINNDPISNIDQLSIDNLGPIAIYKGEWGEVTTWITNPVIDWWGNNYYNFNIYPNSTGTELNIDFDAWYCNFVAEFNIKQAASEL